MTAAEFRKLALAQAGATESAHMGHPDFRALGKIFATLGAPSALWGTVKLTAEQQRSFISLAPNAFKPCNGAWGKRGYTHVLLDAAPRSLVKAALEAARENVGG